MSARAREVDAARQRVVLLAASVLLQYPDQEVRARFGAVRSLLGDLGSSPARPFLEAFLDHAATVPGADLEQHYVSVLDRRRRASLHLTWWTDGETRRRGLALARLKDLYRSRGLELTQGELPDFLPVVLEFAALVDLDAGVDVLQAHRPGLELLRLALVELGTPYAGPVEAVCAVLPGPSPADEAAAMAMARTGPPVETVGLAGYGEDGHGPGPTSLPATGARR